MIVYYFQGIQERLDRQLVTSETGPTLVTIVNSSRVLADVRRDLARVQGKQIINSWLILISNIFCSGTHQEIILIILTQNANLRLNISDIRDTRVKAISYFIIDKIWRNVTAAEPNDTNYMKIIEYLRK